MILKVKRGILLWATKVDLNIMRQLSITITIRRKTNLATAKVVLSKMATWRVLNRAQKVLTKEHTKELKEPTIKLQARNRP